MEFLEKTNNKRPRDQADVFAEGWAAIYRQLTKDQQIFAKRGIDELLTQGQLGMLTYESVSSFTSSGNQPNHSTPAKPLSIQRVFRAFTPTTTTHSATSSSYVNYRSNQRVPSQQATDNVDVKCEIAIEEEQIQEDHLIEEYS